MTDEETVNMMMNAVTDRVITDNKIENMTDNDILTIQNNMLIKDTLIVKESYEIEIETLKFDIEQITNASLFMVGKLENSILGYKFIAAGFAIAFISQLYFS